MKTFNKSKDRQIELDNQLRAKSIELNPARPRVPSLYCYGVEDSSLEELTEAEPATDNFKVEEVVRDGEDTWSSGIAEERFRKESGRGAGFDDISPEPKMVGKRGEKPRASSKG